MINLPGTYYFKRESQGMTEKKFVSESDKAHEEWYKRSRDIKMDQLVPFLNELLDGYSHDQNTIVHAMCAGCLATISAMNGHPEGDIGKHQAHKLLGLFVRKWAQVEGPAKLWSWAGLLHPSNESHLMVIPKDIANWLKDQAGKLLKSGQYKDEDQRAHLIKIIDGIFPWGFRADGTK